MRIKRWVSEAATTFPVGAYVTGYPLFKLMKRSKYLSERWYSLVFSVVYFWGDKEIRRMKELLFADLALSVSLDEDHRKKQSIRILEIGPGFGGNFKYYPPNTELTTVEINNFLEQNIDKIKEMYPNVSLVKSVIGNAETDMKDIPDGSFDVVVGTLILCCIDKPDKVLSEIHRVLAKGGQFYFLENVSHPEGSCKQKIQKFYYPFWKGFTLRCKAGKL